MKITPLGDAALTIHVRERLGSDPARSLEEVTRVLRRLQAARLQGVSEITAALVTVSVFFDLDRVADEAATSEKISQVMVDRIRNALSDELTSTGKAVPKKISRHDGAVVEIPVCYAKEFASDLAEVARNAGLSEEAVVQQHGGATYVVGCIGFAPGFPYLLGLPRALATPRRATPRLQVHAGAVAIGGMQAGIYPQASPGGWNIIGRTPLQLFDPQLEPPALLALGDTVRFRAITSQEFSALSE